MLDTRYAQQGGWRGHAPCVGMMWEISSSDSFLRMVVFPALSRPRTRIRASLSERLSFLRSV